MGDLHLCSGPLTAVPYYIEDASVNVYSLEELCYYIGNHTYLMDKDFMSPELVEWIRSQAGHSPLADQLARVMERGGRLSEFVGEILGFCSYYSADESLEIRGILQELEEKTDFECCKIRADRLMEKEKYLSCIYEYKRLLEMEDAEGQTPELMGDIWHNLGTAYARMFRFEEASDCYERAYSLNQNPESAKEGLFSYKCMQRDIDYMRAAREYGWNDTELVSLKNEFETRYQGENLEMLRETLQEMEPLGGREYHQRIQDMIYAWKEEYRRISKV